jgi:hypothetical protein
MSAAPDLFDATPWHREAQSPAIGMTVRLARDIDRHRPCCNNVAIVHLGKPPHAGELLCAGCGAHRGWLPQATLNFIIDMSERFGAPPEPLVLRQLQKEKAMAFEQNPGRGSLFRNTDKKNDDDRDYSGSINIDGREYWLSGWIKEAKSGGKYLSLSIKPKNTSPADESKSLADEMNDEIRF